MNSPYRFDKFIKAQQGYYEQILSELRVGHKITHWMWFIFPQLNGLGTSEMARHYAIGSLDEARAYLQHPPLGTRLQECIAAVNAVQGRTIHQIFGSPDDMKFHSSLTLFYKADPSVGIFQDSLEQYFAGQLDERTLVLSNSY